MLKETHKTLKIAIVMIAILLMVCSLQATFAAVDIDVNSTSTGGIREGLSLASSSEQDTLK